MPTTTTSSKREKIELTKKRLFFDIEVYFFPEQEGVIDGFANRKKRLQQYIVVPREKKRKYFRKTFFYFWKSARTLSLKKTK